MMVPVFRKCVGSAGHLPHLVHTGEAVCGNVDLCWIGGELNYVLQIWKVVGLHCYVDGRQLCPVDGGIIVGLTFEKGKQ